MGAQGRTNAVVLAGCATLAVAAGCGNPGGDLIALEERGVHFNRLVVTDDGRGSCNGGELTRLPSERLLEAREVERELDELPDGRTNFPAPDGGTAYRAQIRGKTITWVGRATREPVLPKATLLTLRLRRELCPPPASP